MLYKINLTKTVKDNPEINTVLIILGFCPICGNSLSNLVHGKKTKHHSIPICITPVFNILVYIHSGCHKKINNIFMENISKGKVPPVLNLFKQKLVKLSNKSLSLVDLINQLMEMAIQQTEDIREVKHGKIAKS